MSFEATENFEKNFQSISEAETSPIRVELFRFQLRISSRVSKRGCPDLYDFHFAYRQDIGSRDEAGEIFKSIRHLCTFRFIACDIRFFAKHQFFVIFYQTVALSRADYTKTKYPNLRANIGIRSFRRPNYVGTKTEKRVEGNSDYSGKNIARTFRHTDSRCGNCADL